MKRTYQYYLKLTKSKKQKLDQQLKICSWLYNYLLGQFRVKDKSKQEQLTEYQLINSLPRIKKEYSFLKEVQSEVLQVVAKRTYKTWQDYRKLKRLNNKKKYPNFKPSWRYNSLIYPQSLGNANGCSYKIDNSPLTKKKEIRKLQVSLGGGNRWYPNYIIVKMAMERNFQGDAKTLTIKRKNDRYYALFSCDNIQPKSLPKTGKKIGLDLGIKTLIVTSEGDKIQNPKFYKQSEQIIKKAQQSLSNKIQGSQNWKDAKLQLNKRWERATNQFKHYSYQVVNDLVKKHDGIAVEDLNVKGMLEKKINDNKKSLRRSLQAVKLGTLLKVIAEEASIATRQLVSVNPINTSQTCSNCNEVARNKLTLRDRMFRCWNCFLELDRDVNSAKNILHKAERVWQEPSLEIGGEKLTTPPLEWGKYLVK